ncbi:ArsC family reductase [Parachitinimonas caeni]|uniref:ArsC family reductase n=1 Tax=Parachitinimonas caeni TaxID=3031301 RepID=A0ABT7DZA8_9NEIS|nr:ArsC family reductase [Parachitinimonas caeni]MDK2125381.1 ArsC family reductase [Parachitinimonas caeni]
MKMYGIVNCSTIKKARDWLEAEGKAYEFHDYKKQGVPAERLDQWLALHGWQKVLNRQGTTWRKLSPEQQASVVDNASAKALLLLQPSMIKRPVLEVGNAVLLGFDETAYREATA